VTEGPHGIVPSLNTPFTAADRVDTESLCRLVDHTVSTGCAGMLALAVAGETASLSAAERDLVLETVLGRTAGRVPVIVGVTATAFAESLVRARLARRLGAFAVLWQPPAGAGLEAGIGELGKAGPGRVILQDLDFDGPGFPVETMVRLHGWLPALFGVKVETVPAGPKYSALIAATGGTLHVSGGWAAAQMMDALGRGVHAFMGTGMEAAYVAVHRLYHAGRGAEARAVFERMRPVLAFANRHIDVSIRFFKMLRHASGLFATARCRPPVPRFDAARQREAEDLIASILHMEEGL